MYITLEQIDKAREAMLRLIDELASAYGAFRVVPKGSGDKQGGLREEVSNAREALKQAGRAACAALGQDFIEQPFDTLPWGMYAPLTHFIREVHETTDSRMYRWEKSGPILVTAHEMILWAGWRMLGELEKNPTERTGGWRHGMDVRLKSEVVKESETAKQALEGMQAVKPITARRLDDARDAMIRLVEEVISAHNRFSDMDGEGQLHWSSTVQELDDRFRLNIWKLLRPLRRALKEAHEALGVDLSKEPPRCELLDSIKQEAEANEYTWRCEDNKYLTAHELALAVAKTMLSSVWFGVLPGISPTRLPHCLEVPANLRIDIEKEWRAARQALAAGAAQPSPMPEGGGDGQDTGTTSAIRHGPDFRSVAWGDAQYAFTPSQAAAVKALWEARGNRTPDLGEQFLLEAVDSCGSRLRDIFSKHPAWGVLIVPGKTKGTFRLAE